MLPRVYRNNKNLRKQLFLIKQLSTEENTETIAPPSRTKVVVCGGGVMGASVAYHLAKLGWAADTVLIEQGRFVRHNHLNRIFD